MMTSSKADFEIQNYILKKLDDRIIYWSRLKEGKVHAPRKNYTLAVRKEEDGYYGTITRFYPSAHQKIVSEYALLGNWNFEFVSKRIIDLGFVDEI